MFLWAPYNLQESTSISMSMLSVFHDFSLGVICLIFFFVMIISYYLIMNFFISFLPVSSFMEVVWTVAPMIILLFLVIPSLRILYFMESESTKPFMSFKVIGHQWYWVYSWGNFDFESYRSLNPAISDEFRLLDVDTRCILPCKKSVRGLITAADVLHCWALPSAGLKVDATPGRLNQISFSLLRSGNFYGQCSEICGANHSFMPICVESVLF